jgi:four helix bundle protein
MEKENIILNKSYAFALRIVKMYQHLSTEKKEFILSKQVLRSGTSIGANVEEAVGGISKKDFVAKVGIAYKEARETDFWLRLLHDSGYLKGKEFESIRADCSELLKILYSIIKSSRDNE